MPMPSAGRVPGGIRYHPYMRGLQPKSVPTPGVVHVPEKVAPFERVFTDVVERQVDVFPNPQSTISSSNAGQICRFDMPTANFLDMTATGKPLELEFNMVTTQLGDLVGNLCGFLIQNIRVFINNEQVLETLNHGQLNSLWQNATSDKSKRDSVGWALMGGLPDPVNSQSLNSDGSWFNAGLWGTINNAANPAVLTNGRPPFTSAINAGDVVIGKYSYNSSSTLGATGLGVYNIPGAPGMTAWTRATVLNTANTIYFKVPLDIPGGLLGMKKGLIPLFLIPRMRIELTFNPAIYVLFSQRPNIGTAAGKLIGDYNISNLRISLNCIQSLSLQKLYKQGIKWSTSFLGFNNFQTGLQSATSIQTVSISAPFRSLRAVMGYVVNPAQFTCGIPVDMHTANSNLTFGAGNMVTTNNAVSDIQGDNTRWDNFYGGGGFGGGANASTATGMALGTPCTYRGQDASYIISALNFQVNNENLYQQDLITRTQMWDEVLKVIPDARRAPWFDESTFPGTRHVVALNLQSPSLSDNFINGNRAADGNALCYLRIGFGANPNTAAGTSQPVTASPNSVPPANLQFVCWCIHDRVLNVNIETGATTIQY